MNTKKVLLNSEINSELNDLIENLNFELATYNKGLGNSFSINPLIHYLEKDTELTLNDIILSFELLTDYFSDKNGLYPVTLNALIQSLEFYIRDNINELPFSLDEFSRLNDISKFLDSLKCLEIIDLTEFNLFSLFNEKGNLISDELITLFNEKIFKPLNDKGLFIKSELINDSFFYYFYFDKSLDNMNLFKVIESKIKEFFPLIIEVIENYYN